jgi:hypothetical protein
MSIVPDGQLVLGPELNGAWMTPKEIALSAPRCREYHA